MTLEENLTGFADAGQIGDWAISALNWAVGRGILPPESETTLAPTAAVTRALLAQVLANYMQSKG